MTPAAVTIAAAALALYLRELRATRRLRAELSAARIAAADARGQADWLRKLLGRRAPTLRLDAGHEQPAGPPPARLHEPPRHG